MPPTLQAAVPKILEGEASLEQYEEAAVEAVGGVSDTLATNILDPIG